MFAFQNVDSDADCYGNRAVGCSDENGSCYYLGFVWNGTPCGNGKVRVLWQFKSNTVDKSIFFILLILMFIHLFFI